MSHANPVTINLKNTSIQLALKAIFSNQPFLYEVEDGIVYIKPKTIASSDKSQLTVRGKVTDSIGQALQGVVVEVVGTNFKTATDRDGMFTIQNMVPGTRLTFRLLGYESQTVSVNSSEINITLSHLVSQLDEVVISKGYYNVTKELNTGSVSSVKAEVLQRQPVSDPLLALSGRVPGLYIQQNSGIAGSSVNVTLRGRNSIANGNSPLFIVDGVPYLSEYPFQGGSLPTGAAVRLSPLSTIPLSSIESIDVLKDADATAIYGSRGANGVILINTKKAQSAKLAVSADFNQGFGNVSRRLDLMNTEQYLNMRKLAFENAGATYSTTDYDINGTWDQSRYTDWQEVMIGNTAKLTNATIGLAGGTGKTQFAFSGSYRRETTVFPGEHRNRQLGGNLNVTHQSMDEKFRVSFSAIKGNMDLNVPQTDFTNFIILAPNAPALYNEDGSLNWENSTWTNPFWSLNELSNTRSNNLNNDLTLSYSFFKGLTFSSRFGLNESSIETTNLQLIKDWNPAWPITASGRGRHDFGQQKYFSWNIEPMLAFEKNIDKSQLSFLVGATLQDNNMDEHRLLGTGFSSDAQIRNLAVATVRQISSTNASKYRYNALYSRIGYTLDEKYVLNLTGRRDGSSRFGPGKQFGNFWSIGGAWIISKESFFPKGDFVNLAKIRTSYGITGNDQLGDYRFLSVYSSAGKNYQGIAGLLPVQHTNPFFGWESVNKFETALEFGLWEGRISGTFNYYRNRTENQLVGYALPIYTGFGSVQANLPAVVQNSGFEFETQTVIVQKKNLRWVADLNVSFPRNKLLSYPNIESSSYATTFQIGKPLDGGFLYEFLGVNPDSQIPLFKDRNDDGFIRAADDRMHVFIGQRAFLGLNNSLQIMKSVQVDIFLQYVNQVGPMLQSVRPPGLFINGGNVPVNSLGENSIFKVPIHSLGTASTQYSNFYNSTGNIGDASFLRLKNVSVSWSPLTNTRNENPILNNLRINIQGQNLITFTKYKGLDPETLVNRGMGIMPRLPTLRTITIGLQVMF